MGLQETNNFRPLNFKTRRFKIAMSFIWTLFPMLLALTISAAYFKQNKQITRDMSADYRANEVQLGKFKEDNKKLDKVIKNSQTLQEDSTEEQFDSILRSIKNITFDETCPEEKAKYEIMNLIETWQKYLTEIRKIKENLEGIREDDKKGKSIADQEDKINEKINKLERKELEENLRKTLDKLKNTEELQKEPLRALLKRLLSILYKEEDGTYKMGDFTRNDEGKKLFIFSKELNKDYKLGFTIEGEFKNPNILTPYK